ncbi:MAG: hypothetical protein N3A66_07910, partial [Planctomycetota bacterium]|nr:hypothetical protein [Planctomycetota bacterium]
MGKIRAPTSAGKLIKACMNDPEAREAILAALANFPPATAVPFLVFALNRHLNEAETRAALTSLRKLTHQ